MGDGLTNSFIYAKLYSVSITYVVIIVYFTQAGFGPFANKKDEWWADIIATDPTLAEDGKTVVGFKTYTWADEAVKAGAIALYISDSKKGKPGYVGMYLSEDK